MESSGASSSTKIPSDSKDPERFFSTDSLKSDLKGRAVRGGALMITSEIVKQALWMVVLVVMSRLLTPRDNGLIAMVVVVTGCIDLFRDLGLAGATIQRAEINQQQISTLFWINLAVSIGLTLLTMALAPAIAWFYGEPLLVWITVAISTGFIFSGLTVQHRALLRRQMHFRSLAGIDMMAAVFNTVVGIAAAMAGLGYWSLVLMRLASTPLELLAVWLACPWRPGRPTRASGVRSMLAFGGNLTGSRLVQYLMRNIDNLLIGRLYGPQQLGLYARAYALMLLPLQRINTPITGVAIPTLSKLVDSPERYRKAYADITAKVCLLTMPLVAFMVGTSDWLVLVLLGPQWIEASEIFTWLGLSALIEPFTVTTAWLFVSQGRVRQQLHWALISSTLMVTAIIAGLPWGPVGVAASYGLVSLCIRTPLLLRYVGREGPVRTGDLYRGVAPFACAACITVLAIFAFRQWAQVDNVLIGLVVASVTTGVVTLLTLVILPSGRTAIRDLRSIVMLLLNRKLAA